MAGAMPGGVCGRGMEALVLIEESGGRCRREQVYSWDKERLGEGWSCGLPCSLLRCAWQLTWQRRTTPLPSQHVDPTSLPAVERVSVPETEEGLFLGVPPPHGEDSVVVE